MVERYKEFRPYDVRYLCRGHHGEIHEIYDRIVERDRMRVRKFLMYYSWDEARRLMYSLRNAYFQWKKIPTKTSNPSTFRLPREGEKARRL